jgi:hypothetical protein
MSPSLVSLVVYAGLLGMAGSAAAANFPVTSDADAGPGTLRAAVAAALAQAGADEINFDAAMNGRTIVLTSGEIVIGSQQLKVNAAALPGGITLSGNSGSRLFNVPADGSLELRSLTLRSGRAAGGGGAILSGGTLTVTGCTFAGCGAGAPGGAISSSGTCLAEHCTFSGNTAESGAAIASSGTLALTHCTLSGNSGIVSGGGLWNASVLTLTNSIVSGNSAPSGADVFNSGTLTRAGANLVQTLLNSGGSDSGPAAIAAAPQLLPLGSYGGPVPTMLPRAVSPALDRIPGGSFATDQRGLPRVMWGAADIGAVEAGTQTDCAWEVREFYYPQSRPTSLDSLADALALVADPSAVITQSAPGVINHHDPDEPGSPGYFHGDQPVRVDNRTPDRIGGDDDNFATVARAFISITEEDDYTFGFSSSDGARLRIFGASFTSSTRLNASNPANPAHSGDTLSFPGLTDNSATLGVCHLVPGVYPVEFLTWEQHGIAYYEVFAARGVHTSVDAAFRLAGDVTAGGPYTAGSLTVQQLPPVWTQEFEDGNGGFTVINVNSPFDGPWSHDADNGSWSTAGQGSEVAAAPSTKLTSSPLTMHCRGDALLQFTHRFSFEEGNWDGGQVMLSVNDGPFTLVPPAAFTLNGYTGTVTANSIAEIRGEPAFVFDSPGYVVPVYMNTIARLGTFNAGDTLRVQFLASFDRDTSRGTPAWEIDTVSIEQQCAGGDPGWEMTTIRNGADSMNTALTQMFSHWGGNPQPHAVRSYAATVNLFDPQAGGGGHGLTQTSFPGDGPGDDDQFACGARATLNVPATENYTFCVLADDSVRFRIKGSSSWTVSGSLPALTLVDGFQSGGGGEVFGQVRLEAGAHEIELIQHEGFGGAFLGLWGARGIHTIFDPEVFALVGAPGMIRAAAPLSLARQPGVPRPVNDDFAAALDLPTDTVVCTAGATDELGEGDLGGYGASVWWRWNAPSAGTWVADAAGSDFEAFLAAYSGDSLASLTRLALGGGAPPYAARIAFTTVGPGPVALQAGGWLNSTGRLVLSVKSASAPSNDAFASPTVIFPAYSISATGNNDAATAESGEPGIAGAARASVWFSWTAPASGEYRIDAQGSRFNALVAIYTGTALGSLTKIAGNGWPGGFDFTASGGTTYRIAVDAYPHERGDLRVNIRHRAVITASTLLSGPFADSPRTFHMTWQSEPWTTYRIEQSGNLSSWTAIAGGYSSGGSSTGIDITGIPANALSEYFRVKRE